MKFVRYVQHRRWEIPSVFGQIYEKHSITKKDFAIKIEK